jgi:hypothetical protein
MATLFNRDSFLLAFLIVIEDNNFGYLDILRFFEPDPTASYAFSGRNKYKLGTANDAILRPPRGSRSPLGTSFLNFVSYRFNFAEEKAIMVSWGSCGECCRLHTLGGNLARIVWYAVNICLSVPNRGKCAMKRWIIAVLFLILVGYPAVSGALEDTFDRGKETSFSYPLFNIPIGSKPEPGPISQEKKDSEAKYDENKEKKTLDQKVDDAIKKAWEEK